MITTTLEASARFGLGPNLKEMKAIAGDLRGWLEQQILQASIPLELQDLLDNSKTQSLYSEFYKIQRDKQQATTPELKSQFKPQKLLRDAFIEQTSQRFLAQVKSTQPFIERLVLFWSNHFTVSIKKPRLAGLVNPFEVQAIRPHVTGYFKDMLQAVIQHPAMLIYLDNINSIGPNSQRGLRRKKNINENLGREILELHTLGVDGGYTQQDVIALAKIITGWTLQKEDGNLVMHFSFEESMHEPGPKILLKKTYRQGGIEDGIHALEDLAHHPATAKHISTKLARHFIADDPPASAVEELTHVFLQTKGNLAAMYRSLIQMNETWETPLQKFKTGYEFVLSALRLRETEPRPKQILQTLRAINIVPFSAPSPAGLPDTAVYWSGSDAMIKRINWSRILSQTISPETNALALAKEMFGSLLHEESRFIIAGAPSPQDAFAFLLASPEFQRR